MDWIVQAIIPIGVGIAVWYLTSTLESIRRETEKLQDERRKIYMQVLDPYIRILTGINNPSETKKALNQIKTFDYRRVSYELNMMGSDDVVRAMNSLMQHIYSLDREGTSGKPEAMLVYWGGVLLAIRRDLGNNKTGLTEVDMLRGQIKDIDQLIKS